jgi:two-component system chemotaxis response regulator CheB
VVGTAGDGVAAGEAILALAPDVITLDLEMPTMDGLTFLRKVLPRRPVPTIVVSAATPRGSGLALSALAAGAFEIVLKPARLTEAFITNLSGKVKAASRVRPPRYGGRLDPPDSDLNLRRDANRCLLAIGASTGGVAAVERVLREAPADGPCVVITQHMPPVFTRAFAERLNPLSRLEVVEARTGDPVRAGRAYIAPGDRHLRVVAAASGLRLSVGDDEPVNLHRPSVDVLFDSVAATVGQKAVGLLLTGMGEDGARGLLRMRRAGALTLAQDEHSCAVFGMPRAAIQMGAAARVASLETLARNVWAAFGPRRPSPRWRERSSPGSAGRCHGER